MKLCVDCQHCVMGNAGAMSHYCMRELNPVDGSAFGKPCFGERMAKDGDATCGREARFWIERVKE